MTFAERLEKHIPNLIPKVITHIEGWKEMAFRNFMFVEDDEDLSFLSKEPSPSFSIGSPSVSINTELLLVEAEPLDEENTK
ncbi:hypothetical protein Tco_1269229 [Tanacetum coccineum]